MLANATSFKVPKRLDQSKSSRIRPGHDDEIEDSNAFDVESFRKESFESQLLTDLSQISLGITNDDNRFTYLSKKTLSEYTLPDNIVETKQRKIVDCHFNRAFLNSLDHLCSLPVELVNTVQNNSASFVYPTVACIKALRKYFRFYYRITAFRFATNFHQVQSQFINFWRQFWTKTVYVYKWTREDMLHIWFDPKSDHKPNDFLFVAIARSIVYHGQNKSRLYISNVEQVQDDEEENKKMKCVMTFQYQLHWLDLLIDVLYRDFVHFIQCSDNYFKDITNRSQDCGVLSPLAVRLLWPADKRPEYLCSSFKYFISLLVKAVALKIYPLVGRLVKLYFLFGECLRLGTGNVRPFDCINSSRMIIAKELFAQLNKLSAVSFDQVKSFCEHLRLYNWVYIEFLIELLSHHFLNLNHFLPPGRSQKYRLSLQLIVQVYLLGDVRQFRDIFALPEVNKKFFANVSNDGSPTKESRAPSQSTEIQRRPKRYKNTLDTDIVELDNRKGMEYLRYVNKPTKYGGNALHYVCRQGNDQPISELVSLVDPNQTDYKGYTPASDAARHGHTKCLQTLIQSSVQINIQLDLEKANEHDGMTPLHYAIQLNDVDSVAAILRHGSEDLLRVPCLDGSTPMDFVDEGDERMKSILENVGKLCGHENILPLFDVCADCDKIEFYVFLVVELIQAFMETSKLPQFVLSLDGREPNKANLSESPLDEQFSELFARNGTEADLNRIKNDILFLAQLRKHVTTFFNQRFTNGKEVEQQDEQALQKYKQLFEPLLTRLDRLFGVISPTQQADPFLTAIDNDFCDDDEPVNLDPESLNEEFHSIFLKHQQLLQATANK